MTADSIVFDLDGTLWNATFATTRYFEGRLVELGFDVKIPQPLVQSVMGLQMEEIADIYFERFPSETRLDMMMQANLFKGKYLEEHGGILYPNVKETLHELAKKYKLFLVSNCTEEYLEAFFRAHGLREYFVDFENSGRTGLGKAENIKLVVERHQLKNPVYVGDIEKDREASIQAGVPFVFAKYGFGDVVEYDAKVDTFTDLLQVFA